MALSPRFFWPAQSRVAASSRYPAVLDRACAAVIPFWLDRSAADSDSRRIGGLTTGIIWGDGRHRRVVTAAGLVFAATRSSFVFSDLRARSRDSGATSLSWAAGSTLVVRVFMTPSIAVLLGRWFCRNARALPAGCFRPYVACACVRSCCCARATMTRGNSGGYPPLQVVDAAFRGICAEPARLGRARASRHV